MNNTIYIVLILSFTLLISFASVKGTLTDLRHKRRPWKMITRRGWIVVMGNVGVSVILLLQNKHNDNISNQKDAQLKNEREKSDSIIGVKVDSSRRILFKDLSLAFAEQKLKLDTVSKTIKEFQDTTKKSINFITQELPILNIEENGIIVEENPNSSKRITLTIKSYDGASTDLDLKISIVLTPAIGPNVYAGTHKPFNKESKIPKGGFSSFGFDLNFYRDLLKTFFWVRGSFSTLDKTKQFAINALYQYDNYTKRTTEVIDPVFKELILDIVPK